MSYVNVTKFNAEEATNYVEACVNYVKVKVNVMILNLLKKQ